MRSLLTFRVWLLPFVCLGCGCAAFAAAETFDAIPGPDETVVEFSANFSPAESRAGERNRLILEATIREGWHIYSILPQGEDAPPPTSVAVESLFLLADGPFYESRPVTKFDKAIGIRLSYHERRALFIGNFEIPATTKAGDYSIAAHITYQVCSDRVCLPPRTKSLQAGFSVVAGPAREAFLVADRSIDAIPAAGTDGDLSNMLAGGFWEFVGLAALMGLVSLLTPCVFPMIPITISYFSQRADGKKGDTVRLALVFAAGIVVVYTGTGMLMSILFGVGSALQLASNPFVNLAIALLFIVFAFSLMGFFDISLPSLFANYFDRQARSSKGFFGVLLMGFVFTLTAFTCTVQFVGTMMVAAAQGEWIWPLIGMLVFSLVFAFPFLLLALLPGLIARFKGVSGVWMVRTKVVLGILELMASLKFLSNADLIWQTNLLSRDAAIAVWLLLLGCIVVYLVLTNLRKREERSHGQWAAACLFAVLFFLAFRGLGDRSLGSLADAVLPPAEMRFADRGEMVSRQEAESLKWMNSLAEAKSVAIRENKRILLEFTGYTCVNCRWMEQHILKRKTIHNLIGERYVPVRLYTDGGDGASRNLQLQIDRFGTVALPFYAILSKHGEAIATFGGISVDYRDFADFLATGGN